MANRKLETEEEKQAVLNSTVVDLHPDKVGKLLEYELGISETEENTGEFTDLEYALNMAKGNALSDDVQYVIICVKK